MKEKEAVGIVLVLDRENPHVVFAPEGLLPIGLEEIRLPDVGRDARQGGGFFLGGSAQSGYNLPGSVFDEEFRCAFDLLKSIPSARNPSISVTEDFFAFNTGEPYQDKAHILDRDRRIVHGPRFGLSLGDGLNLARVVLTPEAMLDGRRIEEFFSKQLFSTEFWFLWSTIMGSLPQHSAIEFRRYMNRFLYLFPDLSDMRGVMRTPLNQHQFFIEPLVGWLRPHGVNFLTGAFVRDIGFAPVPGRITVDRLDYERGGATTSVAVAPDDLVLVITGSQAADFSAGSMTAAANPRPTGASWALWQLLAQGRTRLVAPSGTGEGLSLRRRGSQILLT
jgi:oleate hydratase